MRSCRVRLEDDAPRLPLLPTREPTPDEGLLVRAWADAVQLGRMASATGTSGAAAARLHAAQAAALDQVLRDRRVPQDIRTRATVAATTTAGGSPTTGTAPASPTDGSPTTEGSAAPTTAGAGSATAPSSLGLAAAEGAAWSAAAVDALARAQAPQLPLLASVAVCRARLAGLGGAPVSWPAWGVGASPADGALVAALREARFYLEVAAARTPEASRAPVQRELDRVTSLVVLLQGRAASAAPAPADEGPPGDSSSTAAPGAAPTSSASTDPAAPAAPDGGDGGDGDGDGDGLGPGRAAREDSSPSGDATTAAVPGIRAAWPLPFPVTDAADGRRLVTYALRTLELRLGACWPSAAGSREAVLSVSRLVHDTVVAGAAWGVPLRAFPGLAP
ncbi:hypothetical protein QK900_10650 [Arsenicicoccus dermatophilus]